jgi:hypothetical protein
MSANLKLKLKGVVRSRADAIGLLTSPGEAVIVSRVNPRWLLMSCPCGCGAELPINLDPRSGAAWRIYRDRKHGISIYPSIWRDSDCRSHFIVWRNKIFLFGQYSDEFDSASPKRDSLTLRTIVANRIPTADFVSYVEVADSLGAVPWDVLDACRYLTRSGSLEEGTGKHRGTFRHLGLRDKVE